MRGNTNNKNLKIALFVLVIVAAIAFIVQNSRSGQGDCMQRGRDFAKQGQEWQAIQEFSKAIEIDPNNVEAYKERVKLQPWKEKIEDYGKLIELEPQNPRWYEERADCYMEKYQYSHAYPDYIKCLEMESQNSEVYCKLASAYLKQGDYSNALTNFNHTLELDPKNKVAYSGRASIYEKQNNLAKAVDDYTKLLSLSTDIKEKNQYIKTIAKIYSRLGDHEKAVISMNKDTLHEVASEFFNEKNFSEAVFYLTKYIEMGGDGYKMRGTSYQALGDYTLAIADYTMALENLNLSKTASAQEIERLNFNKAMAYWGRGSCYYKQSNIDKAIEDYTDAIKFAPNYALLYCYRGDCYLHQGDEGQALANYSKAIEISPEFALAYEKRGNLYQKLGKTAQAEADFAKMKALESQK